MSSFDLIPGSYRTQVVALERLQLVIAVTVGMLAVLLIVWLTLVSATGQLREQGSALTMQIAGINLNKQQLSLAQQRQQRLQQQLNYLQSQLSHTDTQRLFDLVDTTLPRGKLWFTQMRFIKPDRDTATTKPDTGALVGISGLALNHGVLSSLVDALQAAEGVHSVRVDEAEIERESGLHLVNFQMALELSKRGASS